MSRRLVIGSVGVALAAAALALFVVAGGTAGTSDFGFHVSGVPTQLTSGQQGLVIARFQPSASSGAATKTTITFTFPVASVTAAPSADAATSPNCVNGVTTDPLTNAITAYTVTCNVGTVNPGQLVKRFVTFQAGAPTPITTPPSDANITASVGFDNSTSAHGGGHSNSPSLDSGLTIVDGTTNDGTCGSTGGAVHTAPVSTTVSQQTALSFGTANASFNLPCSWGTVGVINQRRGADGAPQISSVGGPQFSTPAVLNLSFASLPSKYHLQENENFDSANPTVGWFDVPPCPTATTMPDDLSIDACLVGYTKGKVIVATLLYRGTNSDPWFN